jgi:hypothetical protein
MILPAPPPPPDTSDLRSRNWCCCVCQKHPPDAKAVVCPWQPEELQTAHGSRQLEASYIYSMHGFRCSEGVDRTCSMWCASSRGRSGLGQECMHTRHAGGTDRSGCRATAPAGTGHCCSRAWCGKERHRSPRQSMHSPTRAHKQPPSSRRTVGGRAAAVLSGHCVLGRWCCSWCCSWCLRWRPCVWLLLLCPPFATHFDTYLALSVVPGSVQEEDSDGARERKEDDVHHRLAQAEWVFTQAAVETWNRHAPCVGGLICG